ncbi:META domain-containing protein [Psychroflexus aestuariivivens]|uniref:META domain-containing protein n=1 Tax=Psychroflexus aestuariivivens TaxID=1795040 RepID=UPI000FD827C8|nr:META domain-containing protein [Psychroflexus aestuariivivens]
MKTMKVIKSLSFVIFASLVLLACKAQKQNEANTTKLVNADYLITHLGDETVSDEELTMEVDADEQRISGYSGCNNYKFEYELDENGRLDLGLGVATKMYCEDSMDLESKFFQKAGLVTNFVLKDNTLSLKSKSGEILIKAKKNRRH